MSTNKGFTLIEILVVVGIVSVVFITVFSLSTITFNDPLLSEYDKVLGILYEKREESVKNPENEYEIKVEDFENTSETEIQIDGEPVFHFGKINSTGSIKLLYGNRLKDIKISEVGGID